MDAATTSSTPFVALLAGLRTFRARVAGTEGQFREALVAAGQPALVREVSRSTLHVVGELLVWLRDGVLALEERIVSIDALLAIGEVTGVLLQELGGAVTTSLPGLGPTAADVTSSLAALGQVVGAFPASALLPTPALVAELREVLEELVGTEDQGLAGTLGELLQDIEDLAA